MHFSRRRPSNFTFLRIIFGLKISTNCEVMDFISRAETAQQMMK